MSGDILRVGVSGLLAYQRALSTTAHNVSNAQTEGYSRQRVNLGNSTPLFAGGGYIGTGVQVDSTERIYDDFLTNQVRSYTSSSAHSESYALMAGKVDELLADPDVGLMPAVENFFSALQDVSNDPSATPPRQVLLTEADTLADRFHYINQRFIDLRERVNLEIQDMVTEINGLASAIGQINKDISLSPGRGNGIVPNDLLDERDRLIAQVSENVAVNTIEQDDGSLNVFIGTGQPLVVGFDANQLTVSSDQYDLDRSEVAMITGAGSATISNHISGGNLGGILDFRDEILDSAQDDFGALAIGFATTFNDQHRLGQDLYGNLGGDFFAVGNLEVLPGSGAPNTVTASLADATQLTGDEYALRYDGANQYILTRLSDNQTNVINTGGASPYTSAAVDGFALTISAGASVGDSFLIRPTRNGAKDIDVAVSDVRDVAAASPMRTARNVANVGNAQISAGSVNDGANLPLPVDVTLVYNAGGNSFNVIGAVPAVGSIPYIDGGTIAFNGLEFSISGAPANGDQFVVSNNTDGVGDNRNALSLSGLQTQRLLSNGTASYKDSYGELVADVGTKTHQAQVTEKAQSNLLEQALDAQQAVSGVNLDEEAANLVRFQQAYQATAQVISAANQMFQTLLNAFAR